MANDQVCILCGAVGVTTRQIPTRSAFREWDCGRCGAYEANVTEDNELRTSFDGNDLLRTKVKYFVLEPARLRGSRPLLTPSMLLELTHRELPSPAEILDNIIAFVGDEHRRAHDYGRKLPIQVTRAFAFGAASQRELLWILEKQPAGILESSVRLDQHQGQIVELQLTFSGWEKYREIKAHGIITRRGFMAMPFGISRVTDAFHSILRPAVTAAGFELFKVADHPRAGLIDDQIMVDIRNCRFVIADMTEENRGAYWEAGFAEGIGKPVIYTCERAWFDERKTHFDTNHRNTVLWDLEAPEDARNRLTAAIRNTLPGEASMNDSSHMIAD